MATQQNSVKLVYVFAYIALATYTGDVAEMMSLYRASWRVWLTV